MALVPARFLLRVSYPCLHVAGIPNEKADDLIDLPPQCRVDNFAGIDGQKNFADVRLAWNEFGLGVRVEVTGKYGDLHCDATRPRVSDGLTLWIDTRDARASHRASRYCHQFHLLPSGGGADQDQPVFTQTKIHRALEDAPLCSPSDVPFRGRVTRHGYIVEAFLPAAVLHGFDPEQNRKLGFFYAVRDSELGEQTLSVDAEFPYFEDPSLWSVLELIRP